MNYSLTDQINIAKDQLEKCEAIIKEKMGSVPPRPRLDFSLTSRTAGTYCMRTNTLSLNQHLMRQEGEQFTRETFVHEYAHACQHTFTPEDFEAGIVPTRRGYRRGKRDVHGYNFQRFMLMMGYQPERCHNYDVSAFTKKKATYTWVSTTDPSVKMELGPKRHKNMLNGTRTYYPRGCRHHTFVYQGKNAAQPAKPAVKTPAPKKTASNNRPTYGKSKKDMCEEIYVAWHDQSTRQEMIARFIKVAGCTPAGAATYYSNCKKKFG